MQLFEDGIRGRGPSEGLTFVVVRIDEALDPLHQLFDTGDYAKLADAFVECALLATRMGNVSLTRWLLERARMHRQQALFLLT